MPVVETSVYSLPSEPLNRPVVILASASPARLTLLKQAGIDVDRVYPADIDEFSVGRRCQTVMDRVKAIARAKAETVAMRMEQADLASSRVIIAADTLVALGRRPLGQPSSREEAEGMLRMLCGRSHRVYSAVCVMGPARATGQPQTLLRAAWARLRLCRMSEEQLSLLLDSDQWRGCAGGYRLQGLGEGMIAGMVGRASTVMGLPLRETLGLLSAVGSFPSLPQLPSNSDVRPTVMS